MSAWFTAAAMVLWVGLGAISPASAPGGAPVADGDEAAGASSDAGVTLPSPAGMLRDLRVDEAATGDMRATDAEVSGQTEQASAPFLWRSR